MKDRDQIQKEALQALSSHYRAGVGITMGGGKTLIGLKHMDSLWDENANFLVVAPKKSIFKEWISQAQTHNLGHLIDHITFTTYVSLPKQDHTYDALYLDECHSLLARHVSWLNGYKGRIIGLTGTPPKFKSSAKGKMVDHFCPIVYKYDTDEAIEDNILNDYEIFVYTLPLNKQKTIKRSGKNGDFYVSEEDTYNYWNRRLDDAFSPKEIQIMRVMRMKALMSFQSKEELAKIILDTCHDKTILFANTQEQADKFGIASYHSKNPDSEKNLERFKNGDILDLACVLQLNEGVNIPNLKCGIILHAYGNERKSSQRIGRLLRLNPKDKSRIYILCYENTVDEQWVKSALENFDSTKIKYVKGY